MTVHLRSMTGYGRGAATAGRVSVEVEIRTVNHRFLDLALRVPRELMAHEPLVQRRVRASVGRGRVELHLRRDVDGGGTDVVTDPALFGRIHDAVTSLVAGRGTVDPGTLLSWALGQPGVLTVRSVEVDAADEARAVAGALDAALSALDGMRVAEGQALRADLLVHLSAIDRLVAEVVTLVADLPERLRDRTAARVARLLADAVEPERVIVEAALLADKADVAEELARLASHVAQFRAALDPSESVGKRLEFLLQEMGREVNTLGSKAVDLPVTQRVIELKTLLERLREQAANVE